MTEEFAESPRIHASLETKIILAAVVQVKAGFSQKVHLKVPDLAIFLK
jgi:hypothetical protein